MPDDPPFEKKRRALLKVYLTAPAGAQLGGHRPTVERLWAKASHAAETTFDIVENRSGEIHGELLSRLWVERVYEDLESGQDVLLSEIDFIPYTDTVQRLDRVPNMVLVRYLTRIYQPDADVRREPGVFRAHHFDEARRVPLVGPWLMKLPALGDWWRKIPRDWLAQGGPFNDAANLAYVRLRESEIDHPIIWLKHLDVHPLIHGADYRRIGVHVFFARALDLPDNHIICWPETTQPLTAGIHRHNLTRLLSVWPGVVTTTG